MGYLGSIRVVVVEKGRGQVSPSIQCSRLERLGHGDLGFLDSERMND